MFIKHFTTVFFIAFTLLLNGQTTLVREAVSGLSASSTITLSDPVSDPGAGYILRKNSVRLKYTRDTHIDVAGSDPWQLILTYKLYGLGDTPPSETYSLELYYDKSNNGLEYNYEDLRVHKDLAEKDLVLDVVSVTRKSGFPLSTTNAILPDDIYLYVEIEDEVYRHFWPSTTTYIKYDHTNEQLQWEPVASAIWYDVEWVHIDAKDGEFSGFIGSSNEAKPFEYKEPVSVRMKGNAMPFKAVYPKGTVYLRVRPVGVYTNNVNGDYSHAKIGTWGYKSSSTASGVSKIDLSTSFEKDLNWQLTTSFAEEGKHKKVISYMDGSLRSRQSVTNLSSSGVSLVGEQLYDYEGRPAVSILPAPVPGNSLNYIADLNKKDASTVFDKSHFDGKNGIALDMTATGSSARYYSVNNEFSNSTGRAYIPDGEGYVYSQTEYTPDNTGRVSRSSGVGKTFRMGGGRETGFSYGTPNAVELYRLFGNNVGNVSHYKKNMVIDPNGQVSVSYLDQEGRTIATALSGIGASNLEQLPSNAIFNQSTGAGESITVDLIEGNVINQTTNQAIVQYAHVNTLLGATNKLTFNYDLAGAFNSITVTDPSDPSNSFTLCQDCEYYVEITISDPDGIPVLLNTSGGGSFYKVETAVKYNGTPNCSNATYSGLTTTFDATFDKQGEYIVTKKLTVISDAEDFIGDAEAALAAEGVTEASLIAQYKAEVDTTECDITCYDHAKTKAHKLFPLYNNTQIEEVIPSIMDTLCLRLLQEALAEDGTECEVLKEMLMADVSPGGWAYMGDVDSDFWVAVDADITNINTSLGQFYQYYTCEDYMDEDLWEDQFAEVLVEKHREYCHYERCVKYEATKAYTMEANYLIAKWTDAKSIGFSDPYHENGSSTVNDKDLLVDVSLPYSISLTAPDGSTSSFSATYGAAIAWLTSHYHPCQNGTDLANFVDNNPGSCMTSNGMVTFPTDDAEKWNFFKATYQGAKDEVIDAVEAQVSCEYYSDGYENVYPKPDLRDSDTQDEITENVNEFFASGKHACEDICTVNASVWLDNLNSQSGGVIYSSKSDSTTAWQKLYDHCVDYECGSYNPFGLLLDPGSSGLDNYFINNFGVYVDSLLSDPYVNDCEGIVEQYIFTVDADFHLFFHFMNTEVIPHNLSAGTKLTITKAKYPYLYEAGIKVNDPDIISLNSTTIDEDHIHFRSDLCNLLFFEESGGTVDPLNITYYGNIEAETSDPGYTSNYHFQYITLDVTMNTGIVQKVWLYGDYIVFNSTGFRDNCFNAVRIDTISCRPEIDTGFAEFDAGSFKMSTAREDCIDWLLTEAEQRAKEDFGKMVEDVASQLYANYNENCLNNSVETFTMGYQLREYHYTLYYYDQSGNLVQTIPPEGVKPLTGASFYGGVYNGVDMPAHVDKLKTKYKYNSLNQLVWQKTPDGGVTEFIYNDIGQLRYSQNAKQATNGYFSYTHYDKLGRITEVGEHKLSLNGMSVFSDLNSKTAYLLDNAWPNSGWEVTRTYYDVIQSSDAASKFEQGQENLRGRVAAVLYIENEKDVAQQDNEMTSATHYSYDFHGNVKELVQEQNYWKLVGSRYKQMSYEYDLLSGNVLQVNYQKGQYDQFYHRYSYDADNRITHVETSRDGERWENDAYYKYYLHGPLARKELGEDQVQGMDYTYTLQGWLKAVNSSARISDKDMGKDGDNQSGVQQWNGRDAIGLNLGYYQSESSNDYKSIGQNDSHILTIGTGSNLDDGNSAYHRLYNGNIGFMAVAIQHNDPTQTLNPQVSRYKYDQLNRLMESRTYVSSNLTQGNYNQTGSTSNVFAVDYDYDANGNIKTLIRYDGVGSKMDDMSYTYNKTSTNLDNNQLKSVSDAVVSSGWNNDISGTHNYTYDAIGNLTGDDAENIGLDGIQWNVYGKIKSVTRNGGSQKNLAFGYGPDGNRNYKVIKGVGTTIDSADMWTAQWYVRDASGNVMAVYDESFTHDKGYRYKSKLEVSEWNVYGSDRLGLQKGIAEKDFEDYAFEAKLTNGEWDEVTIQDKFYIYIDPRHNYNADLADDVFMKSGNVTITADVEDVYVDITDVPAGERAVVGTFSLDGDLTYIPLGETVSITVYGDNTNSYDITISKSKFSMRTDFGTYLESSQPLDLVIALPEDEVYSQRNMRNKVYELTNHLGNVLATVSDLKQGRGTLGYSTNSYYWSFDGSADEEYGSGLDASLNTADQDYGPTNFNDAYTTGTNKMIIIDDDARLDFGSNDFTIGLYVKRNSFLQDGNAIVGKWYDENYNSNNEFLLAISDADDEYTPPKFMIESGNTQYTVQANNYVADDVWVHLVGKREGDYISIYVDGVYQDQTYVGNVAVNDVGRALVLGAKEMGYYSDLTVDELVIFDRALSNSEIEDLYYDAEAPSTFVLNYPPQVDYYSADVLTYSDYYPFGMQMPNRYGQSDEYRYGFQGQEREDDLNGEGNSYVFKYRIHDPRIGRFLSLDPLMHSFPWNSPYAFSENRVIDSKELEGLERYHYTYDLIGNDYQLSKIYTEHMDQEGLLGMILYEGFNVDYNESHLLHYDGRLYEFSTFNEMSAFDPENPGDKIDIISLFDEVEKLELINEIIQTIADARSSTSKGSDKRKSPKPSVRKTNSKVTGNIAQKSVSNTATNNTSSANAKVITPVKADKPFGPQPLEPYNRKKHYGNTPKKSDRTYFGVGPDEVVDHDPPLVQRYYEGDPKTGEMPGFMMTKEQRVKSANDRTRMGPQPKNESHIQGGKMSGYSKQKKKEYGL